MATTIRFCFLFLSYLVKKSFGQFRTVGDACSYHTKCGIDQVCRSGICECRSEYHFDNELRQCFSSDHSLTNFFKVPIIIVSVMGGLILFCIIFSLTKMYIMVRKDRQRIRLRRQQNHISPLAPSLVINEPHLYHTTIGTSNSTTSTSTGLTISSNSTNICFATSPTSPRTTITPTAPPLSSNSIMTNKHAAIPFTSFLSTTSTSTDPATNTLTAPPIQSHSSGTYPITYEIGSAASVQPKPSDLAPNYFGIPKIEVDDGLPSYEEATKTKMNPLPDNTAN